MLGAGLLTPSKPLTEGLPVFLRPSVNRMCGVRDPRTAIGLPRDYLSPRLHPAWAGRAGNAMRSQAGAWEREIVAKRRELVSRSMTQAAATDRAMVENYPIGLNETASGDGGPDNGGPAGFEGESERPDRPQERTLLPK